LSAIREAELSVPGEIALTGFDDIPSAMFAVPPLSTVHVPARELGRRSVEILEMAIDNGIDVALEESGDVLPVELRVRASS